MKMYIFEAREDQSQIKWSMSVIMNLLIVFLVLDTIVMVKKEGTNDESVMFWSKRGPKSNKMIHVGNYEFITSVFGLGHDSYG